jgi:hypothetical protein
MLTLPSMFVDKLVRCIQASIERNMPGVRHFLGYFEQALALSEKYRRHDKYMKIQIENLKQYQKALIYVEKLKFDDALDAFRNYGKTLMKEEARTTTRLMKQLNPTTQQIQQEQLPESLINLFMNHPDELLDYLDYAVRVDNHCRTNTLMTLFVDCHSNIPRNIFRRLSTIRSWIYFFKSTIEPTIGKKMLVSHNRFYFFFKIRK